MQNVLGGRKKIFFHTLHIHLLSGVFIRIKVAGELQAISSEFWPAGLVSIHT